VLFSTNNWQILASLETQREGISKKLKTVAQQQNEAIENDNFEEADHLEVVTMELNETVNFQSKYKLTLE